jgi:hypothetical protein
MSHKAIVPKQLSSQSLRSKQLMEYSEFAVEEHLIRQIAEATALIEIEQARLSQSMHGLHSAQVNANSI